MKHDTEDQILLVPQILEGQQIRPLVLFRTHELTAFRAVNRHGFPMVYTLAPQGLMADVSALLGSYPSLLYRRDR